MRMRPLIATAAVALLAAAAVVPTPSTAAGGPDEPTAPSVVQTPYERVDRGVGAGERFRIYDPSAGESKAWYINDRALNDRAPDSGGS